MQATRRFEVYRQVPEGSQLEVCIDLEEGNVVSDVFVNSTLAGDDEQWGNADVLDCSAPAIKALTAEQGYFVRASIFFLDTVSGQLRVRVRRSEGTLHSNEWTWPLEGNAQDSALAGVFIFLAQN